VNISDLINGQIQSAIAQLLLGLIGLLVTGVLGFAIQFLRTHTSAKTFTTLTELATLAVQAAEQSSLRGDFIDKKTEAETIVNEFLKQAGLTGITGEQIDAAIEAAVLAQFNQVRAQMAHYEDSLPQVEDVTDPDVDGETVHPETPAEDMTEEGTPAEAA
jgi:LL-H family phage holin